MPYSPLQSIALLERAKSLVPELSGNLSKQRALPEVFFLQG